MNTKEAIEFLEKMKLEECGEFAQYRWTKSLCKLAKGFDEVISLLQQGGKYEQMWEEWKNKRPRSIGTYWEKYINRLEQKYFPKKE